MANYPTSNIDQILSSQSQKEVTANENFDAASPAMGFGRQASTTVGLTFGYYGATVSVAGALTQIPNGTLALTASATNYIKLTSAGVVNFTTSPPSGWPDLSGGDTALWEAVTSTTAITGATDWRTAQGAGLPGSAGPPGAGFLEVPSNSQSANYTCVLGDSGYGIDHPATDANARTFTIPANASVAYPVGTCLTFSNMTANVVTIAITSDTLYLAGAGTTGSRSLAQYGIATARKLTSTTWLISGTGLT